MSEDVAVAEPSASFGVKRAVKNQLGQLWASIFFAPEPRSPKTLLVTSAERHEGATQIAASLAIIGVESHAELKVLLVDFNLHYPKLSRVMGMPSASGLGDALRAGTSVAPAVRDTGHPNLKLLAAGETIDQPLGLLRSRGLRTVMEELQGYPSADHVIIDSAAANLYPEAQTLAGLVDGVVLVTRAGETRREAVAEAKKRIEQNGGRLLGVVLNQRRYPIPGFLYRRL